MARSALVLSPEFPFPPHGGGPLRTWSLIEYLKQRHAVDLITFAESPGPGATVPGIRDLLVVPLRRHRRHWVARVWRNAWRALRQAPPLVDRFSNYEAVIGPWVERRRYDLVLVEHLWAAPYAPVLRPRTQRLVLDLHNIESLLQRRLGLPFAAASRRLEQRWIPLYDQTLVASEADAQHLGQDCVVYPNSLPPRTPPVRSEGNRLAMSGNFAFPPNRRGLRWFLRDIWPTVRRELGCELHLIGRDSERWVATGITASGPVEDALAELATARIAIVPLRAGSGTRLKILEAWQAGTPVVSTTMGAEGLPVSEDNELVLANTAEAFRAAIRALWNDEPRRRRLAQAGHRLLNQRYLWPAAWAQLDRWLF